MIKISMSACIGCLACVQSCPQSCISVVVSEEGFLYPSIDESRCLDCGKCDRVCPVTKDVLAGQKPVAYAAYTKEDVREQSSSGGLFTLLAEEILGEGGCVFGAAFGEDFSVRHIMVDSLEELSALRGSKYLQSCIENTYFEAKTQLKGGRKVLFSGTPCQIAGLKSYLGKDYDNLICQDVICHSAPSPAVWRHYLRLLSDGKTPEMISFRNKDNGWEDYSLKVTFREGGAVTSPGKEDPYIRAFIAGLISRESCYSCKFREWRSGSDITLADCWGVASSLPEAYDERGVSLILLHSEKGKALFRSVAHRCQAFVADYDKVIAGNPAAFSTASRPKKRETFFHKFRNTDDRESFRSLYQKCAAPTLGERFRTSVRRSLPYRAIRKIYRSIFLKNKDESK